MLAAAALLVSLGALVVALIALRVASRGGRQRLLLDHRHTIERGDHRITTSWVYGVQAELLVKEKPL